MVGGSSAGLFFATVLKHFLPPAKVTVLEKEKKLGKKLLATGNGHCNISRLHIEPKAYNHPEYLQKCLALADNGWLDEMLSAMGILTQNRGELLYPLSFSASSLLALLENGLRSNGVDVVLDTKVEDYVSNGQRVRVETNNGTYECDLLVIASGGASSPNLGSDGSFFEVLRKHGYQIVRPRPGLTSIKTNPRPVLADGSRHPCHLKAYEGENLLYEETGEVLFRNDGLSGICVMNAESSIERHYQKGKDYRVVPDLFPDLSLEDLRAMYEKALKSHGPKALLAFLDPSLCRFVESFAPQDVPSYLKDMSFAYQGSSGFAHSQVTLGGVDLSEIDEKMRSTRESGVAFIGEVLDVDGLCGGFNLSWCLLSSYLLASSL